MCDIWEQKWRFIYFISFENTSYEYYCNLILHLGRLITSDNKCFFTFPISHDDFWCVWQIFDMTFEWVICKTKSLWMRLRQFQKIYITSSIHFQSKWKKSFWKIADKMFRRLRQTNTSFQNMWIIRFYCRRK